jgi:hypothetical protein
VVVDEEVYRLLPALLIATVDKFAQMPWKGETQMLFGRVNSYCPRHGYGSPELSCPESHRAGRWAASHAHHPAGPLRPPDLIIQDELHLISGPLGTLVGLYETAVDRLCEWEAHGQRVRPSWWRPPPPSAGRASRSSNSTCAGSTSFRRPAWTRATTSLPCSARRPPTCRADCYVGIAAPGTRVKALLIRVYMSRPWPRQEAVSSSRKGRPLTPT